MPHRPDCPCPICRQGTGRNSVVLSVRLPRPLADWLREQPEPVSRLVQRLLEAHRNAE